MHHTQILFSIIVLSASIFSKSVGFEITETSIYSNHSLIPENNLVFIPGESVKFSCVTSDWYEFCSWKHDDQICQFEWKRSYGEVKKQNCDTYLNDRIEFIGNYNEFDCSIELSNLTLSDAGKWTCDLESYVWGPISGSTDTAEFNLMVDSDLDYNETLIDSSVEHEEEDEGK